MAMKKYQKFPKLPKRTNSKLLFPARTQKMFRLALNLAKKEMLITPKVGIANGRNFTYVQWLKRNSMLIDAATQARSYSGKASLWQNPYAKPQPRRAIQKASVWFTAYPLSTITKPKDTILQSLADPALWETFQTIGIQAVHTGPMKLAGGIKGWKHTPSIDGHFDRISNKIDPLFGTEKDYKHLSEVAKQHNGIIIDDIVPGHTGKSADFRLAEMNYRNFPGIYHMIEIDKKDWQLLPVVAKGNDSANINPAAEEALKKAGYIIGKLQRVIFYEPGIKETNWSATKSVVGTDGIKRRWVYLHYFKEGQPTINWLDPTFAGMQLVIGDGLHSIGNLGATGLRLDANGFLGIEKSIEDAPAWSEGHPLSATANELIAGMVRKAGGFTFQELNLSVDDIKEMSIGGADLSYDFVNRPAYHHALVTQNTEFLRLTIQTASDLNVDPVSLVHALQNHDELTFELVHFWTTHKDDIYTFRHTQMSGLTLRDIIRRELQDVLAGPSAPYNLPFTENGIACTTVTVVAAALGIRDVSNLTEGNIIAITQAHLLLAFFNAMQPGVFALSGWDLTGALTLDPAAVQHLMKDGDTRWINRGAYDLINANPEAQESELGLPRAKALYGSLTDQLLNPTSFASRLRVLLAHRKELGLATAKQLGVVDCDNESILAMVHKLPDSNIQASVLNFSKNIVTVRIQSNYFTPGSTASDSLRHIKLNTVSKDYTISITLAGHEAQSITFS